MTNAELPEVAARLGSNIIKELEDNLARDVGSDLEVHEDVAAAWRLVVLLLGGIVGELSIDHVATLVGVSEVLECPLEEGIDSADVLSHVQNYKWRPLVMIESSLEVVLYSLDVLVPLGLEELQHCGLDVAVSLEFLEAGQTSLVLLV